MHLTIRMISPSYLNMHLVAYMSNMSLCFVMKSQINHLSCFFHNCPMKGGRNHLAVFILHSISRGSLPVIYVNRCHHQLTNEFELLIQHAALGFFYVLS